MGMEAMRISGYAKTKKDMNAYITGVLKKVGDQGIHVNKIIFLVDEYFGLGRLCVTRRLDLLEENGFITKVEGIIKWVA